jgi:hypothetical protein
MKGSRHEKLESKIARNLIRSSEMESPMDENNRLLDEL